METSIADLLKSALKRLEKPRKGDKAVALTEIRLAIRNLSPEPAKE